MTMKPIKTKKEYQEALERLEHLIDKNPKKGTKECGELSMLAETIGGYEQKMFPVSKPDPVEAIKFRMDQQGLRQADLLPYFSNSRSVVSATLNKKRFLTVKQIRKLHYGLNIPLEILVQEYDLDR